MKLLFLTPQLPYPPHQGTTIRNYNLIKGLASRHQVSLLSFVDGASDLAAAGPLRALCQRIEGVPVEKRSLGRRATSVFLSPLPDVALRLRSHAFEAVLDEWLGGGDFDVVQVEGIEMAHYGLGIVGDGIKPLLVFDDHNAEYKLQKRAFQTDAVTPRRWIGALYSLIQWQKLRRYERRVCREFDRVVAVSSSDAAALQGLDAGLDVTVVPNGVDLDYYRPGLSTAIQVDSIVFTGKMDFRPNVDAVTWFCREILPLVKQSRPNVRFSIVGQNPSAAVRGLQDEPGVRVTGYVDDVRTYIAEAAVYVAPLRMGSGTRLKVLEAMAMEKAIVATELACEGIDVTPGQDVVLADGPAALAERIVTLLDDPGGREALGRRARALVEKQYGWEAIVPKVESIYTEGAF